MGNEQMKMYEEGLANGRSTLESSQNSLDSGGNIRVKHGIKKSNSIAGRVNYPKKPVRRISSMKGAKSKKSKSAGSGIGSSSSSSTSSIAVDDDYNYLEDNVNGSPLIDQVNVKKHRGAMSHGDLPGLISYKHHTLENRISESQEPNLSDDDPWRMQDSSEDCASNDSNRELFYHGFPSESATKEFEIDQDPAKPGLQSQDDNRVSGYQTPNLNQNAKLASNLSEFKNYRGIISKFPNYNRDKNSTLDGVLPEPVSLSDFVTWLEDRSQPLTSDQSSHKLQQFMQKFPKNSTLSENGSGLDPFSEAQEEEIEKLAALDEGENYSEDEFVEASDKGKAESPFKVDTEDESDDEGSIFSLEDIASDDENTLLNDNMNDIDSSEQTKTRSKDDAGELLIQWLHSDKCKPPTDVSDKESKSTHGSNQIDNKPCNSALHELRVLGNDDFQNSELDRSCIDACTNPAVTDQSTDLHCSKATPSDFKTGVELHSHVKNKKDVTLMAISTSAAQFNDCQEVLCTNINGCTDNPLNFGSNMNGSPVQDTGCKSESAQRNESSSFVVDVSKKMQERSFVEEACGINHDLPANTVKSATKNNEYALFMAKHGSLNNMGNEGSTEHVLSNVVDNTKREEYLREDEMTALVDNNKEIADGVSLPEAATKERQQQREENVKKVGTGIVVDVANSSNTLLKVEESSIETVLGSMGAEHSTEKHSHRASDFQNSANKCKDIHQNENEDINVLLEQDNKWDQNTSGNVINNSLVGEQDKRDFDSTYVKEPDIAVMQQDDDHQHLHEESISLEQSNLQAAKVPVIAEKNDVRAGNNSPSSSVPGSCVRLANGSEAVSESISTNIKGIAEMDGYTMSQANEGPQTEMSDGRASSVQKQEIDKTSTACSDVEILPHQSCFDKGSSQIGSVGVDMITSCVPSMIGELKSDESVNENTMAKFDEQLREGKPSMTDGSQELGAAQSNVSVAEDIKQLVEELCDNVTENKTIIAKSNSSERLSLDPSLECTERKEFESQRSISDSNLPDQADLIQMDYKLTNESTDAENDIKVSLNSTPSDTCLFGTGEQKHEHIAELSERKVNNNEEQFYGVGDRQLIIDHTDVENTESTDVSQPDTDRHSTNTEEYNSITSSESFSRDTDTLSNMGNQPPGKAKNKKIHKKDRTKEETNGEEVVFDESQEITDNLEGVIETVQEHEGQNIAQPNLQSDTLLGSSVINRETPAVVTEIGTKQQEVLSGTCLSDASGSHTEHGNVEEMDCGKVTGKNSVSDETEQISDHNPNAKAVTDLPETEEIVVEDQNETSQADNDTVEDLNNQVLDTLATQTDTQLIIGHETADLDFIVETENKVEEAADQEIDEEEYEEALHNFANDFVNEIIEAIVTDGVKEEGSSDSSRNSDEEIPFAAYASEKMEVDGAAVQASFQATIPRIEITDDTEQENKEEGIDIDLVPDEALESEDILIANETTISDQENQMQSGLVEDEVQGTVEGAIKVENQQGTVGLTEIEAVSEEVSISDNNIQDNDADSSQTEDDEKVETTAIIETINEEPMIQHSDEADEDKKKKESDGEARDLSNDEDAEKPDEIYQKNATLASEASQNETANAFPLAVVNKTEPGAESEIKDLDYNETMETVENNETQTLSDELYHSGVVENKIDMTTDQNTVPSTEEPMMTEDMTATDKKAQQNREISLAEDPDSQDTGESTQGMVLSTEEVSNSESVVPEYYKDPEDIREMLLIAKGERLLKKKQQLEKESIKWKIKDSTQTTTSYSGLSSSISLLSRSSDDSTSEPSVRELKDALAEIEEKYKQAMVQNAQLDNERTQLNYRVEQLKDGMEEQEEEFYRVKREHKEKCQELERDKRMHHALKLKYADLQEALRQRDELIQEQGLVLVGGNGVADAESDEETDSREIGRPYALVSHEAAQVLESAGDGSLDVRLKNLAEEKQDLCDQIHRLKAELEEERRNKGSNVNSNSSSLYAENGVADMQLLEIQREASKQISDYKFKLQKTEQEYNACQANVTRMELQLQRLKTTSELLEKSEDEMRVDKRKLQRDLRAALDRIEEMEMTNAHLEKRLERMRATRTAQATNQT